MAFLDRLKQTIEEKKPSIIRGLKRGLEAGERTALEVFGTGAGILERGAEIARPALELGADISGATTTVRQGAKLAERTFEGIDFFLFGGQGAPAAEPIDVKEIKSEFREVPTDVLQSILTSQDQDLVDTFVSANFPKILSPFIQQASARLRAVGRESLEPFKQKDIAELLDNISAPLSLGGAALTGLRFQAPLRLKQDLVRSRLGDASSQAERALTGQITPLDQVTTKTAKAIQQLDIDPKNVVEFEKAIFNLVDDVTLSPTAAQAIKDVITRTTITDFRTLINAGAQIQESFKIGKISGPAASSLISRLFSETSKVAGGFDPDIEEADISLPEIPSIVNPFTATSEELAAEAQRFDRSDLLQRLLPAGKANVEVVTNKNNVIITISKGVPTQKQIEEIESQVKNKNVRFEVMDRNGNIIQRFSSLSDFKEQIGFVRSFQRSK